MQASVTCALKWSKFRIFVICSSNPRAHTLSDPSAGPLTPVAPRTGKPCFSKHRLPWIIVSAKLMKCKGTPCSLNICRGKNYRWLKLDTQLIHVELSNAQGTTYPTNYGPLYIVRWWAMLEEIRELLIDKKDILLPPDMIGVVLLGDLWRAGEGGCRGDVENKTTIIPCYSPKGPFLVLPDRARKIPSHFLGLRVALAGLAVSPAFQAKTLQRLAFPSCQHAWNTV